MTPAPPAAVFLVRAWWDEGQFRARITYCLDIVQENSPETRISTADTQEVSEQLARWLDEAARLHLK